MNVDDLLNPKDNEPEQEKQPSATRTSVLPEIKESTKVIEQPEKPITQPAKPHNLVETYAFETYVDEFIKLIDKSVKDGLENVPTEQDIAKQLKQIDDVRELLVQKAKIQNMIPEFNKTSDLLKTIQSNLSHNLTK